MAGLEALSQLSRLSVNEHGPSAPGSSSCPAAPIDPVSLEVISDFVDGADWAELPPQLVQSIMDLMPSHERRTMRCACRSWRRGSGTLPTPPLKLAVTRKLVKPGGHLAWLVQTFPGASTVELRLEHCSEATFRRAVQLLCRLEGLKHVTLNSCCGAAQMNWACVTRLAGVTSLHAHGICMGYHEAQALPKMAQLQELCLRCLYLDESCLPSLVRCTQLTSLSLSFDNITWDATLLEAAHDLLRPLAALTRLRSLELHCHTWPELADKVMDMMPHLATLYQVQLGTDFNLESCSQWDRRGAAAAQPVAAAIGTSSVSSSSGRAFSSHVQQQQQQQGSGSSTAGAGPAAAGEGAAGNEVVVRSYDLSVLEGEEEEEVQVLLQRALGVEQLDCLQKLKVTMTGMQPSLVGLAALPSLTGLALVHLPANPGGVPAESRPIGSLRGPTSLQQLKVQAHYDDHVAGSFILSDVCLAVLAREFPQLTKLEFDGAIPEGMLALQQLSELTSLREIHLTSDEHGAPPSVACCHLPPSLAHVTMMSMNLRGPAANTLPKLMSLDLEWCIVQDMSVFSAASQLQELYLWHCDVATPLSRLPELFPLLRVLSINDVHSQQKLGWAAPAEFPAVTRLRALRTVTWITPSASLTGEQLLLLGRLPALRELALAPGSNTQLEDLRRLSCLQLLHRLEIRLGLHHESHRRLLTQEGWQPLLAQLERVMPLTMVTFTRDPGDLTT